MWPQAAEVQRQGVAEEEHEGGAMRRPVERALGVLARLRGGLCVVGLAVGRLYYRPGLLPPLRGRLLAGLEGRLIVGRSDVDSMQ